MIRKVLSPIKHKLKLRQHKGDKYTCPICNFKAKDLYTLGVDAKVLTEKMVSGAGRRNAGCYNCFSSDRERLVYTYLKEEFKVFEKKELKILHLAPENNFSGILHEFGFQLYSCGDLFTEGYSYPEYVQNMNVLSIPHEDETFDLIICNHLLEHVPEDIDAMKELFRVLKTNGQAILQVPFSRNSDETYEDFSITSAAEREKAFGQFDHVRIYGKDYFERLESVGFRMQAINISEKYPKHGLAKEEDLFIASK